MRGRGRILLAQGADLFPNEPSTPEVILDRVMSALPGNKGDGQWRMEQRKSQSDEAKR